MKALTRVQIENILVKWYQSWNDHNLDDVMKIFHDEAVYVNWSGVNYKGKRAIKRAWESWFNNHQGFRFIEKETFIDEVKQKVLFRWILECPSKEKGVEGLPERREGVDILHFNDGKIIRKLTFSKTSLEIDGRLIRLSAQIS